MEVGRTGTTNEAQREARRSKDGVAGPPTLIRRAKGHEERRNQGTGAQNTTSHGERRGGSLGIF